MDRQIFWQKAEQSWEQSRTAALLQGLYRALSQSRFIHFLLGDDLAAQTAFFQKTLSFRILAGFGKIISSLLHLPGKLCYGSLSARILSYLAENSYFILIIASLYPLLDFCLRKSSALSILAGSWDELLILLGTGLIMVRFIVSKKAQTFFTPLDLPLLLFLGTGVFLYLFRSPEKDVAIDGFRATFEYVLWYFLAVNTAFSFNQKRLLIWSMVTAGFIASLYGIYQYIVAVPIPPNWVDQAEAGVRTRVFSFIGSPNVLGSYLVLLLPVAAALFQITKSRRARLFLAASTLAMLACLVFTFSRGAWLAFLASAAVFGVLQDRRFLILILAGAILLPAVSPSVGQRLQYTFSSKYIESSQRGGRFARWDQALDRLAAHPVTGVGLGRFGGATAARHNIPGTFYVDNYYLKLATETGLVGAAAFLWVILSVIRLLSGVIKASSADPVRRALACGITAGVVGVLIHNGVENIFEVPMMQTLFWILLGVAAHIPLAGTPSFSLSQKVPDTPAGRDAHLSPAPGGTGEKDA